MVFFTLLYLPLLLLLLYFIVRPHPVTIPIKNRHVFITGGSIGIGLAIAKQAASEGARISLLARSLDKLKEAKQSIEKAYDNVDVSIFAADVRDYDAVQVAIKKAGPIDVLVVNHGVYNIQELENQESDTVKFMIDVNLMGSINVIKAALPLIKDRKDKGPASIAFMSSMAGQKGTYGLAAYSATKFGLRGLAEALQQELISDNIHISIIFAPAVDTPGLEEARKKMPEISKIMHGSDMMKAEEIGKITINGIKSGKFSIPCNLLGQMVAVATAGVSPQRSFFMASIEVVFAGFFRFLALLFQFKMYGIIQKWHPQKRK
ncbi:Short-chain dehydrogenase/reductase SDR [Corchorus capsularis]|uniref:3-dehydrosphinganine reductase n=1 Tax=Corchorus capsularis TaxID=210143 RepID=A0A1R3GTC3_COCAP|nr:Short-chain dehydrogenase/reductase SDR [Corchorus capsularis]